MRFETEELVLSETAAEMRYVRQRFLNACADHDVIEMAVLSRRTAELVKVRAHIRLKILRELFPRA